MSKYINTNEAVTVTKIQRCNRVTLTLPTDGVPSALFTEEVVTQVAGQEFKAPVDGIGITALEPTATFDIYDTATGIVTGATMSYQDLLQLIQSMYLTEATKRDATQV